jgi:hypothetical protein
LAAPDMGVGSGVRCHASRRKGSGYLSLPAFRTPFSHGATKWRPSFPLPNGVDLCAGLPPRPAGMRQRGNAGGQLDCPTAYAALAPSSVCLWKSGRPGRSRLCSSKPRTASRAADAGRRPDCRLGGGSLDTAFLRGPWCTSWIREPWTWFGAGRWALRCRSRRPPRLCGECIFGAG